jgi:serine/threonine protein kinase
MQALLVVASKLAVMHAGGWVHRDLKPGNILRMPAMHSWTLIDFGCSARTGEPPSHA